MPSESINAKRDEALDMITEQSSLITGKEPYERVRVLGSQKTLCMKTT